MIMRSQLPKYLLPLFVMKRSAFKVLVTLKPFFVIKRSNLSEPSSMLVSIANQ